MAGEQLEIEGESTKVGEARSVLGHEERRKEMESKEDWACSPKLQLVE